MSQGQNTSLNTSPPVHPVQQIITRLNAEGYAPVLRRHDDKPVNEGSHFLLDEYWRLDNPNVKALIRFDLSRTNQITVTFQNKPAPTLPVRLFNLFRGAAMIQSITIDAEDFDAQAVLPFANNDAAAQPYKNLSQILSAETKPRFYLRPEASDDKMLVLSAYAEDAQTTRRKADDLDTKDFIGNLARSAAKYITSLSEITLRLPRGEPGRIEIMAHRAFPRSLHSVPQSISLDQFNAGHADLIQAHLRQCRRRTGSSPAPRSSGL